VEIEFFED